MPETSTTRPVIQQPGFWAGITAGVLALAALTIALLNSLVYNPESAVEEYVDALQAGDGETAMALSNGYLSDDAPDTISTVLLDGDELAASAAFLEGAEIVAVDAEVPDSYVDEQLTQRVVEIRYRDAEDNTRATPLVVDKTATSWLFFDQWQLHPIPLQQVEIVPTQMPEHAKADEPVAQVHGQPTPLLADGDQAATVAAFAPSLIELEYHGTFLAAPEPQHHGVIDVLDAGATSELTVDIELTSAVDEAITEEVTSQLQRCTEQTVLKPAGCPFGYETPNRVVPDSVSWAIDVPEVEYSWTNSEPKIDRINATAVLTAQEIDIGSGQPSGTEYEEAFDMSADLELTPENIRVRPDWE